MSHATYITGDVRDVLAAMPDGSVDLVLTSPPFLALRSYLPADHPDKHREIGAEPGPAEFIDTLLGLTAEWRRVLAPHGSIAIELGDTYAGSGGAGGDYAEGGMRDGQEAFAGSARKRPASRDWGRSTNNPSTRSTPPGWPLDKSLTMIPELYRVGLAYGINPLTGQASPADRWRARNVVRWCRPNPPVGALGDKVRPGTSDMVIGCTSRTRYFDLDAIREPSSPNTNARTAKGVASRPNDTKVAPESNRDTLAIQHHHTSAPPLDHWWSEPDADWFDQDAWLVSTEGYKGSHYATWPRKLLTRPILAMCPERVCTTCGEPSRRIVQATSTGQNLAKPGQSGRPSRQAGAVSSTDVPSNADRTTVGWSDCGHGTWRSGVVLDPFAGSGTTLAVATGHGRDAIGIDFDVRNVDLALERVGPLYLSTLTLAEYAARLDAA